MNNPLKYRDEDGNTPLLLAIAGVGYGVGQQYFEDRHNIQNGVQSGYSSLGEYALSGVSGGITAVLAERNLIRAVALSGPLSVGSDLLANKPVSLQNAAAEKISTAFTGGILKVFPSSIAELPKTTSREFFTKETATTIYRNSSLEVALANVVAAMNSVVSQARDILEKRNSTKK